MTVFSTFCAFLKGFGMIPVPPVSVQAPEGGVVSSGLPVDPAPVVSPQFSEAGLVLLKTMESCRLEAYDDATGEPVKFGNPIRGTMTIGYGFTGPSVVPGLIWTQAKCDAALLIRLSPMIAEIRGALKVSLTDNEFSALVSLAYNIGPEALLSSATLATVNEGIFGMVTQHIASWNEDVIDGRKAISPGLVGRRAAECALWNLETSAPIPDFAAIRDQAVINYRNQTLTPLTA